MVNGLDPTPRSDVLGNGRGARITLALRVLSAVATVLVGVATLLPNRTASRITVLAEGRDIGAELGGPFVLLLAVLSGLTLMGVAWRSGLAARLRVSWSLLIVGVLYVLGFAVLASATTMRALAGLLSAGLGGALHRVSVQIPGDHLAAYAALTIVVLLAWRQKIATLWLAPSLFFYGYALELLQRFAPGREFGVNDLAANALGIGIGVIGILLFDLLAGARSSPRGQPHVERRRRRKRSSRSTRPSGRARLAGLVTALAGLLIVLASVLAGSMAEFGLAQIGRRLLAPLSAAYALTFWLGVTVMAAGWLVARGLGGRRRERARVRLP
jgi:hypothetical protein